MITRTIHQRKAPPPDGAMVLPSLPFAGQVRFNAPPPAIPFDPSTPYQVPANALAGVSRSAFSPIPAGTTYA